jgi:hypothetical protein
MVMEIGGTATLATDFARVVELLTALLTKPAGAPDSFDKHLAASALALNARCVAPVSALDLASLLCVAKLGLRGCIHAQTIPTTDLKVKS